MSDTSINEKAEITESVIPCLEIATREDHIKGGTLHLHPELWLEGETVPTPEDKSDDA